MFQQSGPIKSNSYCAMALVNADFAADSTMGAFLAWSKGPQLSHLAHCLQ